MGQVTILKETTKNPISLMGERAGVCYGSNIKDNEKNYNRGLDCLASGHGRVQEFVNVEMIIDGYSVRVIREYYTHIGGSPTRLQSSTRYIDYSKKGFDYITPTSIANINEAKIKWDSLMQHINKELLELETNYNISKEDVANGLPLGMATKIVDKRNLRNLVDMSHVRLCTRAYWEYRQLMRDICIALSTYSDEWKTLVGALFIPKCEITGYCNESKSCGRKPKKDA